MRTEPKKDAHTHTLEIVISILRALTCHRVVRTDVREAQTLVSLVRQFRIAFE